MSGARAHGEGTVGEWHRKGRPMVYRGQTPPDLTGRRRSVTGKTMKEAAEKLRVLIAQMDAGITIEPGLTLGTWLDLWLDGEKPVLAPTTWASYESHVRLWIKPTIGHVKLEKLRPEHVKALHKVLRAAGKKQHTVRRVHSTLRASLTPLVEDRRLATNPASMKMARPGKAPVDEVLVFKPDEIARILTVCRDGYTMTGSRSGGNVCVPKQGMLVVLAEATGMRLGELLALHWSDVDLDAGTINVHRSLYRAFKGEGLNLKGTKSYAGRRILPIEPETVAALRAHRKVLLEQQLASMGEWADNDFVFRGGPEGRPLEQSTVKGVWWRIRGGAEVREFPFKSLRATFGTRLARAGVPMTTLQYLMGHESITTTARYYVGVDDDDKRDAIRRGREAI